MEGQYKKIFTIAGASLLGIAIIFLAWKGGELGQSFSSKYPLNSLSVVSEATSTTNTSSVFWNDPNATRDLSTSTTDTLVYDLITNYANTPKDEGTTTLSDAQVNAQAEALAKDVQLPPAPQFAISDLIISEDNSPAARTLYFTAINKLLLNFYSSQKNDDLAIIFASPDTMDAATRSTEIGQNIALYEALDKGLLTTKTPSGLETLHLGLVQSFSDLENSLNTLAEMYNDPVKGLAAFAQYQSALENIHTITLEYQDNVTNGK